MGRTVEGELGHVGDNAGAGKLENPSDYFTDPETAADFVKRTGVDSLAVAVGNAHGDYAFPPKLDFERIRVIAEKTGIPLVLHGGSGLSDTDFKTAVKEGVAKVNMMGLIPYEIDAMKEVVRDKILLFGSNGKA